MLDIQIQSESKLDQSVEKVLRRSGLSLNSNCRFVPSTKRATAQSNSDRGMPQKSYSLKTINNSEVTPRISAPR